MAAPLLELEATWEEIAARGAELAGRRVRVIVLPEEVEEPYPGLPPEARPSTAASLLAYVGAWVGDDLQKCLKDVYSNRTKARL